MFGPELPGAATVQRAYGLAEHGDTAFVVVLAHGQGIKNGRDPGRDDLGVVGEKGGHALRPEHFGARDEMLFEVVGVKLHKAGHQVVAFQIDAFRERARAVVEETMRPSRTTRVPSTTASGVISLALVNTVSFMAVCS